MPMVRMDFDDSTLIATSIVSAVITFGFCIKVGGIKPLTSLAIAAIVGIGLYWIGVIPIGFMLAIGIGMVVAIVKSIFQNDVGSNQQISPSGSHSQSSTVSKHDVKVKNIEINKITPNHDDKHFECRDNSPLVSQQASYTGIDRMLVSLAVLVGILILIVIFVVPRFSEKNENSAQINAIAESTSKKHDQINGADTFNRFSDRLRSNPPLTYLIPGGEAWVVSAHLISEKRARIIVKFTPLKNGATLLHGKVGAAISILRQSFCGTEGLLLKYELTSKEVLITAYEGATEVGESVLPENYCSNN